MGELSVVEIWGVDDTLRIRSRGLVFALMVGSGVAVAVAVTVTGGRVFGTIWPVATTRVLQKLVLESPRYVTVDGCTVVFPFPETNLSEICATGFVIETAN